MKASANFQRCQANPLTEQRMPPCSPKETDLAMLLYCEPIKARPGYGVPLVLLGHYMLTAEIAAICQRTQKASRVSKSCHSIPAKILSRNNETLLHPLGHRTQHANLPWALAMAVLLLAALLSLTLPHSIPKCNPPSTPAHAALKLALLRSKNTVQNPQTP